MDLFGALQNMLGLGQPQPQTQDQYVLDAQKRSGARTDTQDGLATLLQFMAQDPAGQQFAPPPPGPPPGYQDQLGAPPQQQQQQPFDINALARLFLQGGLR